MKFKDKARKGFCKKCRVCNELQDFCKHYCTVCEKKILVPCGTPIVIVGGCCSGVEGEKTFQRTPIHCHYACYQKRKGKVKTRWTVDQIRKRNIYILEQVTTSN